MRVMLNIVYIGVSTWDISDFYLFFMWKLHPTLEKNHPPLSQEPSSKSWGPAKPPPPFLKIWLEAQPPTAERGCTLCWTLSETRATDCTDRGWMWRFWGRLRTKECSSCISFTCFCRCWCFCLFWCWLPHAKSNVLRQLAISLCFISTVEIRKLYFGLTNNYIETSI